MKISRILLNAVVITLFTATTTTAFAAPDPLLNGSAIFTESEQHFKKGFEQKHEEFDKDPIKMLERRKEKIKLLLEEGKIDKKEADEITARIDLKIKEIQSFNKLSLQKKKEKLVNDCRAAVEKRVQEGKLDRSKADTIIKNYTEKINKWDGNGYPQFHSKRFKGKCKKIEVDS